MADALRDLDWLFAALAIIVSMLASGHVVLHKRDVRSAAGWASLVWLVPGLGALLYLLLGINRIRRRALSMRRGSPRYNVHGPPPRMAEAQRETLPPALTAVGPHLAHLAVAIGRVTGRKLLPGNHVEVLVNGDEAYPAMLRAIEGARRSVTMATYIFETQGVGARFVDALAAAQQRGVQVRVLIDAIGARYSAPRADRVLRRRGLRAVPSSFW